jgi:hypothetical protein
MAARTPVDSLEMFWRTIDAKPKFLSTDRERLKAELDRIKRDWPHGRKIMHALELVRANLRPGDSIELSWEYWTRLGSKRGRQFAVLGLLQPFRLDTKTEPVAAYWAFVYVFDEHLEPDTINTIIDEYRAQFFERVKKHEEPGIRGDGGMKAG